MEPSNSTLFDFIPACSFKPMLSPAYEKIKAECDPWILAFAAPASAEAARFLHNCLFPLFCCLAFAECQEERLVPMTKFFSWIFLNDTDDDDLSIRGCATDHVWQQRRNLILECFSSKPLDHSHLSDKYSSEEVVRNITKGLASLHDIWKDISRDMPLKMQSRFLETIRQHLDANMKQAHLRRTGCVPSVDDYIKLIRRPASLVPSSIILLEYGLGIELDEETLQSELMLQLHDTAVDQIALYNDLFSFKAEMSCVDYFNLPSVIFQAHKAEPGFTLANAVREAVRVVEELDKLSVRLIAEVRETSSLAEKPGVEAFLRGLGFMMAGNVKWSSKTARYSQICSPEGVVLPVHGSPEGVVLPAHGSPQVLVNPVSL